ncbi:MAG: hypothetical protein ACKVY0_15545 [Prosthecobacter sp.]|uniref:hypothetical protein n=1 Tax=Prosthecobacter sp. TaxID=1965333 RepID=UPI0038FE640F
MKHDANDQTTGIIGMGLMGSALMKMTGADRGWDVDLTRCVNASPPAHPDKGRGRESA